MVNTKPSQTRPRFLLFIRYTFHTNAASVSPRNISAIEHCLRKGGRQLEMYEDNAVTDCWVSADMIAWDVKWRASVSVNAAGSLQ